MNPSDSDARFANDPEQATPNPPRPPFTIHDIVFGQDGLRPVWGILTFLALFEAFRCIIPPLVVGMFPISKTATGDVTPLTPFVFEGASLLCVFLATWLLSRLEQRPAAEYGFGPENRMRNFAGGLVAGVALLSVLIAMLRVAGFLVFDARLLFGRSILHYAIVWFAAFLMVALLEESLSRGYLQFTLGRGLAEIYRRLFGTAHADALGFWTAALLLSFIFGYGHRSNPGESPLGMLSAGLAGFLFCFSLWRTGSLWWAIGFHTTWDWAQSFLYGVADSGITAQGRLYATHVTGRPCLSGGLTGPEGSLFLLPVILAGVAVVVVTLPRHNARPSAALDFS